MGGECEICGYNKPCLSVYTFHHIDPTKKEFNIGGKTISFERLKKEADKCQLLCRNCHGEIHDKEYEEVREKTIKEWKEYEDNKQESREKKNKQCPTCKIDFKVKENRIIYCSQECSSHGRRKVSERPSKEQLLKEIKETNYCAVGRKYGVSDNAIRKWLK